MGASTERLRKQADDDAAATLLALKRYRGLTDEQIGRQIGRSSQTVNNYVNGVTGLDVGLIFLLAKALDVEPRVLLMKRDDALRWAIENRPEPLPRARAANRPRKKVARSSTKWYLTTLVAA